MRRDSVIGDIEYDKLIADAKHPLDVETVTLSSSQGNLKRGALLAVDTSTGKCTFSTGSSTETVVNAYVLADDVENSDEEVTVQAYNCGSFVKEIITVKNDTELALKDLLELRKLGIYLK